MQKQELQNDFLNQTTKIKWMQACSVIWYSTAQIITEFDATLISEDENEATIFHSNGFCNKASFRGHGNLGLFYALPYYCSSL